MSLERWGFSSATEAALTPSDLAAYDQADAAFVSACRYPGAVAALPQWSGSRLPTPEDILAIANATMLEALKKEWAERMASRPLSPQPDAPSSREQRSPRPTGAG